MRILGIDLGRSRTGIALSDPVGLTCRPFGIVAERDEAGLIAKIAAIVREEEVGQIVIGLPRPLSGGTNRQLESVLSFSERLRRQSSVPVVMWDERFTTKLAEAGRPKGEAQDAVAACYMLQSYLDAARGDSTEET
ncbi:MAG: Holliday junction resolvase RuvX [Actinomycetia bacterium]|nr:Holliday junction resolvase RuvX [Actinomycetes bacterium]